MFLLCFFLGALSFVCIQYIIYPLFIRKSWEIYVNYDPSPTSHPPTVTPGWSLWGEAPGYDARGWFQMIAHLPIFIAKISLATLTFPFYYSKVLLYHKDNPFYITDENVFDICTRCTLVMFVEVKNDGSVLFKMDPARSPTFGPVGNCDPQSLRIEFSPSHDIVFATSANGPVTGTHNLARNEILAVSLRNVVATWVHTSVHVAAERCALEIQAKRICMLEPTSRFVSSLHEGLIHHDNIGPLGKNSPFVTVPALPKMVEQCYEFPVPPHTLHPNKSKLELYYFFIEGRKVIYELVREFDLPLDPEDLFLALVVHGNDHAGLFQVMAKMNPCSSDASGSMLSYWRIHCFTHMWLGHWDNPFGSEMVTAFTKKNDFYRKLYSKLATINRDQANNMVISCCF